MSTHDGYHRAVNKPVKIWSHLTSIYFGLTPPEGAHILHSTRTLRQAETIVRLACDNNRGDRFTARELAHKKPNDHERQLFTQRLISIDLMLRRNERFQRLRKEKR